MVSDSITNASIHAAPNNNNNNARDVGKKKRARSAKLKQCKLDVRREQWLSQGAVKNKDFKAEQNGVVEERKDRNNHRPFGNLGMRPGGGENDGSIHHHHHHDSDLDSNSPNSLTSSVLGSNYSETNFTGSSSSSSSSSSSGGCCSGNITEDDEGGGDDGCLDDWEAVADALAANEKSKNPCLESPPEHDPIAQSGSPQETTIGSDGPIFGVENSKPQCARTIPKASGNGLAWRPDDAFRPQSLPNLAKQWCFLRHPHVLYAMKIWISRTRAFCHACADSGSAFSATRGFSRRIAAVLAAGSPMSMSLLRQRQVCMEVASRFGCLVLVA
ncbi:uncharacterized protein Pyn_31081 [Prunus yedoensis var. nudiflora]|uniref:Uncharacterized protein n=1 Tax=Prunus yedoensis var. nudiflora TaxID=2094558 RepID=A0A314XWQ2_PRUYE|nr:uncharacterized protein Pyn_31081 [Prunus yedoensis var. nudiflora]